MAITKNKNRQFKSVAEVAFDFADLASGVAQEAVDLPSGAVRDSVQLYVDEAWNSATSDVIEVGDAASNARHIASVSVAAVGGKAPVTESLGYKDNAHSAITIKWTGVGAAPTAGKARLIVEYHHTGAGDFAQG